MEQIIKLYIVGDESTMWETTLSSLKKQDIEISGFLNDKNRVIEELQKSNVDIVIIEVEQYRIERGLGIAHQLKEKMDIPFIFISNHSDTRSLDKLIEMEPYGIVMKPFSGVNLYSTVLIALERYSNKIRFSDYSEDMDLRKTSKRYSIEDSVFVEDADNLVRIRIGEILLIHLNTESAEIILKSGKHIIKDKFLDFVSHLPFKEFIQIHEQYLININEINGFGNGFVQILNYQIPIADEFNDELLSRITQV